MLAGKKGGADGVATACMQIRQAHCGLYVRQLCGGVQLLDGIVF